MTLQIIKIIIKKDRKTKKKNKKALVNSNFFLIFLILFIGVWGFGYSFHAQR